MFAHRGASGDRPEHTRSAYEVAIAQGADGLEIDVVATSDGVLVCRHEHEIGATTDVAGRPEFADRRTTRTVPGRAEATGWFVEDFTYAELRTLRARERMPRTRPGNTAYDGTEPVPALTEVLDLVVRTRRSRPARADGRAQAPGVPRARSGSTSSTPCWRRSRSPGWTGRATTWCSSASSRPP